ncbi:MAG TPA: hypothetical protein VFU17_01375 [Candidatus Limnocylindrales bacterium]|nr:hypothetical protein [Candidatus Limnocylindrales bacterium]
MRGRNPRNWIGSAIAASLLVLATTAGGAQGARPALIEIEIDFDTDPPSEHFTTNTPLLCPEGDVISEFHRGAGNFAAAGTFHLNKLLVCEDDSGSFVITVDAASNFVVGDGTTGGWSVVPGSGTGDYVSLRGGGHVVGVNQPGPEIELIDYYSGHLAL